MMGKMRKLEKSLSQLPDMSSEERENLTARGYGFKDSIIQNIGEGIQERATNKGRSIFSLTEEISDTLFSNVSTLGETKHLFSASPVIDLYALSVPFPDLNKIAAEFKLPGFADQFRDALLGQLKHDHLTIGIYGSRIYFEHSSNLSSEIIEFILNKALTNTRSKMIDDIERWDQNKRGKLEKALNELPFYAAQVPIILQPPTTEYPAFTESHIDHDRIRQWLSTSIFAMIASGPEEYSKIIETRRRLLSSSATYWLLSNDPQARENASFFIELLFDESARRLNERIEIMEKLKEGPIREMIDGVLADPHKDKKSVRILDESMYQHIDRWVEAQATPSDAKAYYDHLQMSRTSTPPLFRYDTGHLPRPGHLYKNFKSALENLDMAVKNWTRAPSPEKHKEIMALYDRLFGIALETVIFAFRDDRLPEVHKLGWMDEALRADQNGTWESIKDSLSRIAANESDSHYKARFERAADLLTPGVFVARRAIGDEVGYAIRVGKRYALGDGRTQ